MINRSEPGRERERSCGCSLEAVRGSGKMKDLIWNFFRTGPDIAQIADSQAVKQKFNSLRWRVFASITIGYAFYYIIRQSYSVIKKPLLASGIVTPTEVGIIGSVFFVTYGLGKFTNSFLADRMPRRIR